MIETKFKQTEIGLIPEEWESYFIEDITNTASGGTPSRSVSQYFLGNIKWFTTSELNDCELNDSLEHISEDALKSSSCKLFPSGTLLMAMYGATIGKLGILNDEAATNQACCAIFQSAIYETKFLYYWLLKERKNIITQGCGAGQPNISQSIIKKLLVPVPPIQEQQHIVTALSDIDALISALNKKIEKKKLIKQGAMQQLLIGQKRLQGFSEPWVEKRLGEMCSIYRGGSPRPIENFITNDVNGINWIKIGDVEPSSKYIIKTAEKIRLEGESKSRKVYAGDFILSNSMSFGRPYILKIDGCIHDGWLVIQNYQEYFDLDYLYYLLGSEYVFEQYKKMAAGSSVQNLNKDKVSNVLVRMPLNKTEQTAIAEILSDMDNEIVELESKRTKYDSIKQGMMQQLLTGKIRLID